jgi:hypothetical protein
MGIPKRTKGLGGYLYGRWYPAIGANGFGWFCRKAFTGRPRLIASSNRRYSPAIGIGGTMISDPNKLRRFRDQIQSRVGGVEWARPFVCNGNPYDCSIFLVGFNPASNVEFWKFWKDECGFDKAGWSEAYRAQRLAASRSEISPSRKRIEELIIAAKSPKILETNLYAKPSRKERDLRGTDQNSSAFCYMLAEIQPRILLLHGSRTWKHFSKIYTLDRCPTHEFTDIAIDGRILTVASVPHFAARPHTTTKEHPWSADRVIELGQRLAAEVIRAGIA